ncbi:MAG: YfhO family protein [Candidatus Omnitrophota bacterium]
MNRIKRISKQELIALIVIFCAIAVYTLPLFLRLDKALTLTNKNCITAWYRTYNLSFFTYTSILTEKNFPFWCPFREGGFYWTIYPSELSCNFFSPLMLFFGLVKGLNLSWYLLYFAGAFSMFYLTRKVLKYSLFGAIYSAIVFSMCGYFAFMQGLGFWTKETMLLPLLVAFSLKSKFDNRYIFFTAIMLALLVPSLLFFPIIILFLLMIACSDSVIIENKKVLFKKRSLVCLGASLVLAVCFSAFKILPVAELLKKDMLISGPVYELAIEQANTWKLFFRHMFIPENSNVGTMYIGYLPVFLMMLAFILEFKRNRKWILILILFIILSFGPNSWIDLNYFLWKVPFFKSIREVSKYYTLLIVFLISLTSGSFFCYFKNKKTGKYANSLFGFLILLTFLDLFWANFGYFNIYNDSLKLEKHKDFIAHVKAINIHKGDEGPIEPLRLALFQNGYGLVNAQYDRFTNYFKESFTKPKYLIMPEYVFMMPSTKMFILRNPDYAGEAYFLNKRGQVRNLHINSRGINAEVEVLEPDILLINQKFADGWKTNFGKIKSYQGIIAVEFKESGNYSLRLQFVPISFFAGFAISIISLAIALFVFWRWRFNLF